MRSAGYALAMVIAAVGGACAQTAPQYDLTCTGNVSSSAMNPDGTVTSPAAAPSPYTTKLHIDLKAKSFCEDDCKASQPLYSVGADAIIFNLPKGNTGERFWMARDLGTFFKVWTETGDVRKNEHELLKSASGQCVLVPSNAVPASVGHDVSHPAPPLPNAIAASVKQDVSHPATPLPNAVAASVKQDVSHPATPLPNAVAASVRQDVPHPASPAPDHSTHAAAQANLQTSSELASDDITALVNVSNHRPIEPQQIARLHTLGYVGWSADVLTLTAKGRNLVGGN
jgi:hypothetical protein